VKDIQAVTKSPWIAQPQAIIPWLKSVSIKTDLLLHEWGRGTRYRSWLRATNWKFAGSIVDYITEFFN
jgi:hypothetical protein